MQLLHGQVVAKNLRLIRLLGEGGMGCVWTAEHTSLGIQVAVKFVLAEHASNADAVLRFSREARAVAQIKHPHVVQILDHGVTEEGLPYIAMELLEGEELTQRITRLGSLSLSETLTVLKQTSRALGKAHAMGIIHRDIKPDNIFLCNVDGEIFVKVLDFGIAKRTLDQSHGLTGTNSAMGTAYYMSPEQFMSAKHVDHRTDLWALTVAAYQCLTGELPFQGETMPGVFIAIDKGLFMPPSQRRKDLPTSIDAWFKRALDHDVEKRFSSAKELVEAFERAIDRVAAPRVEAISRPSILEAATSVASTAVLLSTEMPVALSQGAHGTKRSSEKTKFAIAAALIGVLLGLTVATSLFLKSSPGGYEDAKADSTLSQPSSPVVASSPVLAVASASASGSSEPRAFLDPLSLPVVSSPRNGTDTKPTPPPGAKSTKPTDRGVMEKSGTNTGKATAPSVAPPVRKPGF